MTHNTRTIPLRALKYPSFVQYGGQVYRAWRPIKLAVLGGYVLIATDTSGDQHALVYGGLSAPAEVVIG